MVASTRLSALVALIAFLAPRAAVTTTVIPPASQGQVDPVDNSLDLSGTTTDTDAIVSTVSVVSQKSGPTDDTPPNQPVPATVVTAVDGRLTEAGSGETRRGISMRSTSGEFSKRTTSGYELVFSGTGTNSGDRDASIQGTAYLTYKLLSNATYDVDGCLEFCSSVKGCVFANIYYEFNNELLDFVFNEKSNLKCALYADVHTAAEKTNSGGQQSEPSPAGLTYIQQSSGYASTTLVDPPTPDGYELVFGPSNGANNAPGYMGFAFLEKYDVNACSQLCNTRNADPNGGACQYFNIWRALVNGIPTTYTCSMYFLVADGSTAVNTGQGDLQVTFSRGYRRKNFVFDGGFEGYTACSDFCFTSSYANWIGISVDPGDLDASIFFFAPYAHAGHGSALLGSAFDQDGLPGTLTPASPLKTVAGQHYTITFFHASVYSGRTLEAAAFVQILWNGNIVSTITPGYSAWTFYSFDVVAKGNDVLAFHGGRAPAWSFLDDICVFLT
ncbi:uncharacterized protein LACBIDRAFT_295987 [Laccaria bicolor S238N-H82]|uniref:Predicted protein n=1 Tax=Laccaria bicolor (strain S238N-H82 / ATCC MYA-4686) TaxID=486041 RepID=B0E185_LACBS|nr:uncharacterized protein LACBIDRAFT_295987 [Laccaria bicolor S238N-H82]EDQ99415.1 predicted protein [Laccaria bicolor S238N-H82]|eukprot:XP_001889966.1 predicted protein [Laccaria bicolor S238N-H82]